MRFRLLLLTCGFALFGFVVHPGPAAGQDRPACESSASDPDGDGWGWENSQSCRVVSGSTSGSTSGGSSTGSSSTGGSSGSGSGSGVPACESSASDPDGDGWGWENNQSCRVVSGSTSGSTTGGSSTTGSSASTGSSSGGSGSGGSGGSASTTAPIVGSAGPQCVGPNNQYADGLQFGDFAVWNNAWNAGVSTGSWSQCISLRQNSDGTVSPQWTYDWLNENQVVGPLWNVKAYPEIVYGVKEASRQSASTSVTGLPSTVNQLDDYTIDFSFSSSETTKHQKSYNGQTIYGEKNVAIESFFHSDCNIQRGASGNQMYEIMVWLDSGPERRPAGSSGYKGDANVDGRVWEVWTKGASDPGYMAFVAKSPVRSGSLNWNSFIDYAAANGQANGTRAFNSNWCMANLLFGSEIWWGEGLFSWDELVITH